MESGDREHVGRAGYAEVFPQSFRQVVAYAEEDRLAECRLRLGYDRGYRGRHVTANRVEPAIEWSAAALVEKSNFRVGHYAADALVLEVRRQIEVV